MSETPTALEVELALTLDAVRVERDVALAKLADADAKARGWCEAAANLVTDVEAAEEWVRVLESALTGLGTHIPDVGECFKPDDCRVWHWKHVPACEGARKALEPPAKTAPEPTEEER